MSIKCQCLCVLVLSVRFAFSFALESLRKVGMEEGIGTVDELEQKISPPLKRVSPMGD